jgi:hypothetical protein
MSITSQITISQLREKSKDAFDIKIRIFLFPLKIEKGKKLECSQEMHIITNYPLCSEKYKYAHG